MTKKTIVFPGWPFTCDKEEYRKVIEIYDQAGLNPEPAEIDWSMDLETNVRKAEEIVGSKTQESDNIHLFGHSWGAVCALWASRDFKTDSLVLASLSPEFEEDRNELPKWRRKIGLIWRKANGYLGKPGKQDFKPSLEELRDMNAEAIHLLYGEREFRGYLPAGRLATGKFISDERLELLPNSHEKVVDGAGHMLNENYLETIEETVSGL